MRVEEAIKKAIEGGWQIPEREVAWIWYHPFKDATKPVARIPNDSPFLDPSFWQSLGKAMGWEYSDVVWLAEGTQKVSDGFEPTYFSRVQGSLLVMSPYKAYHFLTKEKCQRAIDEAIGESGFKPVQHSFHREGWKDQWHRFIDHLAEGKTAEEFFDKELHH